MAMSAWSAIACSRSVSFGKDELLADECRCGIIVSIGHRTMNSGDFAHPWAGRWKARVTV